MGSDDGQFEHLNKMCRVAKRRKPVVLYMQNQLIRVETQVAIALAYQHMLEKKQKHAHDKSTGRIRKVELAVDKNDDDLARAAACPSLEPPRIGRKACTTGCRSEVSG